MKSVKPLLLLILDGFGLAPAGPGNAISLAHTPTLDRLLALPGVTSLAASALDVGLPEGFIGNSEVGHLNIGAGRIVYQDMTRIDLSIKDGSFFKNQTILDLCSAIRSRGGRLHFMGLLSDGGVHSHIRHLEALLKLAHEQGVPALVHAFTDGRDTSPCGGAAYVEQLQAILEKEGGRLATLCGRYYAMDRDKRWDRVNVAWDLLLRGKGEETSDPAAALRAEYARGTTDEFIPPKRMLSAEESVILPGDGIFFFNFRADRARELAHAFLDEEFDAFERGARPDLAGFSSMVSYDASLHYPVAFKKENLSRTLGEVISQNGLRQLRIAETEKYAHVTYFFNGGREQPFEGEERILVESPRDVPTYDLKPAMSAPEVTERLLEAWNGKKYDFFVCNLANPDMVGHTGVLSAAVEACEVVDACVSRLEQAVSAAGGRLVITADHGNVERMLDDEGKPQTAHTMNRTPLIVLEGGQSLPLLDDGRLSDIAPTLLELYGLSKPEAMTGRSLLAHVQG